MSPSRFREELEVVRAKGAPHAPGRAPRGARSGRGRSPAHYTDDTVRLVREAGFRLACTGEAGVVTRWTDPFRLPRLHVTDCDGDQFERLILVALGRREEAEWVF